METGVGGLRAGVCGPGGGRGHLHAHWTGPADCDVQPVVSVQRGLGAGGQLHLRAQRPGRARKRPILFDEYHHGFAENLAWALTPTWSRWALAQFLVAFGVLVYARSRRFGRVVPLLRESRERNEFLTTMTALLRQGEASRLAVRTAYEAAQQRAAERVGAARKRGGWRRSVRPRADPSQGGGAPSNGVGAVPQCAPGIGPTDRGAGGGSGARAGGGGGGDGEGVRAERRRTTQRRRGREGFAKER